MAQDKTLAFTYISSDDDPNEGLCMAMSMGKALMSQDFDVLDKHHSEACILTDQEYVPGPSVLGEQLSLQLVNEPRQFESARKSLDALVEAAVDQPSILCMANGAAISAHYDDEQECVLFDAWMPQMYQSKLSRSISQWQAASNLCSQVNYPILGICAQVAEKKKTRKPKTRKKRKTAEQDPPPSSPSRKAVKVKQEDE